MLLYQETLYDTFCTNISNHLDFMINRKLRLYKGIVLKKHFENGAYDPTANLMSYGNLGGSKLSEDNLSAKDHSSTGIHT